MSVMPCRLNGDVHEWFNEVVTVPSRNLPNSLTGANAGVAQWEAKTLWTFTTTCCCGFRDGTQNKQERRNLAQAKMEQNCNTTYFL